MIELTQPILAEVLLCAKYWAPTQVSGLGSFSVLLQPGQYKESQQFKSVSPRLLMESHATTTWCELVEQREG